MFYLLPGFSGTGAGRYAKRCSNNHEQFEFDRRGTGCVGN